MPVIVIQLGQCGNQLGCQLFDRLARESSNMKKSVKEPLLHTFFSLKEGSVKETGSNLTARCALVDMEPKVVMGCLETSQKDLWQYDTRSVFCQQGGSANNWAFGFSCLGPKHHDSIVNIVQRLSESCEEVNAMMLLQSVAGGTGSGVGAFVGQCLRDDFPGIPLLNICVLPFAGGEVSVQSYNCALSISCVYEHSDGIFLFENDRLQSVCRSVKHMKNPSFSAINDTIADSMIPSLLPVPESSSRGCRVPALPIIARDLCSHSSYKLLTTRNLPQNAGACAQFSTESYAGLLRRLKRMFLRGSIIDIASPNGHPNAFEDPGSHYKQLSSKVDNKVPSKESYDSRTISHVSNNSGGDPTSMDCFQLMPSSPKIILPKSTAPVSSVKNVPLECWLKINGIDSHEAPVETFQSGLRYSSLTSNPLKVTLDSQPCNGYPKSTLLISNCQTPLPALRSILSAASRMFDVNAYVHQYEQFGIEREDIFAALDSIGSVVQNYEALSGP